MERWRISIARMDAAALSRSRSYSYPFASNRPSRAISTGSCESRMQIRQVSVDTCASNLPRREVRESRRKGRAKGRERDLNSASLLQCGWRACIFDFPHVTRIPPVRREQQREETRLRSCFTRCSKHEREAMCAAKQVSVADRRERIAAKRGYR